jgi:MerR family transcriptional regulator, light-induced transcriptional regulator
VLKEALSERFAQALLEGDAVTAEMVARIAYDEEMPYAQIHDGIVAPAMHRIGRLWERGEINVANEHVATQISMRVLALLRELFGVARRRSDHRVMLAAVEGEQHIVALQMVGDLLEDAGYEVVMLGPDVPVDVLEEITLEHRPSIVGFSLTMASCVPNLARAIEAVVSASPATGLMVGGNATRSRIPEPEGLAVVTTVVDAVEVADTLVHRPHLN